MHSLQIYLYLDKQDKQDYRPVWPTVFVWGYSDYNT